MLLTDVIKIVSQFNYDMLKQSAPQRKIKHFTVCVAYLYAHLYLLFGKRESKTFKLHIKLWEQQSRSFSWPKMVVYVEASARPCLTAILTMYNIVFKAVSSLFVLFVHSFKVAHLQKDQRAQSASTFLCDPFEKTFN